MASRSQHRGPAQPTSGVRARPRLLVRARLGRARRELRSRAFPYVQALRAQRTAPLVSRLAVVRDPRHVGIGAGARIGPHAELWAFDPHPQGGAHAIEIAATADIRSFALLHAYGGSISVGRGSCVNHFCFVSPTSTSVRT